MFTNGLKRPTNVTTGKIVEQTTELVCGKRKKMKSEMMKVIEESKPSTSCNRKRTRKERFDGEEAVYKSSSSPSCDGTKKT